jgi:hypothetical protein
MLGKAYDPREPRILSKKEIATIRCGLQASGRIYLHQSLIPKLPRRIKEVVEICLTQTPGANIIGISRNGKKLSLLTYPRFGDDAHPVPARETIMNLDSGTRTTLEYTNLHNLPILMRKEKLIPEDHPRFEEFRRLTEQEESAELIPENNQILELKWQERLEKVGAYIEDHTLQFSSRSE